MLTPHPDAIVYLLERLEKGSHIDESTGCKLWDGPVDSRGYGRIKFCGKRRQVHRLAYTFLKTYPWQDLMHSCDRPNCWNVDHLKEGTAQDNTNDMIKKGRAKFWGRSYLPDV